jgi:hypothetical protein
MMGDISKYRPSQPQVRCRHCSHVKGDGKPDKVESTALHFGLPPSRYGVLLIRVNCHGEQQDIACTFKWLEANQGQPIEAFSNQPNDYGLRDMIERDGYSLPTNLTQCAYQLEAPSDGTGTPFNVEQWIERNNSWLTRNDARTVRKFAEEFTASATHEARTLGKSETYGKYVLARFVRRMDSEIIANEQKGDWNKLHPDIQQMCKRLARCAQELTAIIKRSESSAVSTGPVTELCADLANMAMKAYETFGTPATRPARWIDDALPNPVAGTEHDLPMRSAQIDIKPEEALESGQQPARLS